MSHRDPAALGTVENHVISKQYYDVGSIVHPALGTAHDNSFHAVEAGDMYSNSDNTHVNHIIQNNPKGIPSMEAYVVQTHFDTRMMSREDEEYRKAREERLMLVNQKKYVEAQNMREIPEIPARKRTSAVDNNSALVPRQDVGYSAYNLNSHIPDYQQRQAAVDSSLEYKKGELQQQQQKQPIEQLERDNLLTYEANLKDTPAHSALDETISSIDEVRRVCFNISSEVVSSSTNSNSASDDAKSADHMSTSTPSKKKRLVVRTPVKQLPVYEGSNHDNKNIYSKEQRSIDERLHQLNERKRQSELNTGEFGPYHSIRVRTLHDKLASLKLETKEASNDISDLVTEVAEGNRAQAVQNALGKQALHHSIEQVVQRQNKDIGLSINPKPPTTPQISRTALMKMMLLPYEKRQSALRKGGSGIVGISNSSNNSDGAIVNNGIHTDNSENNHKFEDAHVAASKKVAIDQVDAAMQTSQSSSIDSVNHVDNVQAVPQQQQQEQQQYPLQQQQQQQQQRIPQPIQHTPQPMKKPTNKPTKQQPIATAITLPVSHDDWNNELNARRERLRSATKEKLRLQQKSNEQLSYTVDMSRIRPRIEVLSSNNNSTNATSNSIFQKNLSDELEQVKLDQEAQVRAQQDMLAAIQQARHRQDLQIQMLIEQCRAELSSLQPNSTIQELTSLVGTQKDLNKKNQQSSGDVISSVQFNQPVKADNSKADGNNTHKSIESKPVETKPEVKVVEVKPVEETKYIESRQPEIKSSATAISPLPTAEQQDDLLPDFDDNEPTTPPSQRTRSEAPQYICNTWRPVREMSTNGDTTAMKQVISQRKDYLKLYANSQPTNVYTEAMNLVSKDEIYVNNMEQQDVNVLTTPIREKTKKKFETENANMKRRSNMVEMNETVNTHLQYTPSEKKKPVYIQPEQRYHGGSMGSGSSSSTMQDTTIASSSSSSSSGDEQKKNTTTTTAIASNTTTPAVAPIKTTTTTITANTQNITNDDTLNLTSGNQLNLSDSFAMFINPAKKEPIQQQQQPAQTTIPTATEPKPAIKPAIKHVETDEFGFPLYSEDEEEGSFYNDMTSKDSPLVDAYKPEQQPQQQTRQADFNQSSLGQSAQIDELEDEEQFMEALYGRPMSATPKAAESTSSNSNSNNSNSNHSNMSQQRRISPMRAAELSRSKNDQTIQQNQQPWSTNYSSQLQNNNNNNQASPTQSINTNQSYSSDMTVSDYGHLPQVLRTSNQNTVQAASFGTSNLLLQDNLYFRAQQHVPASPASEYSTSTQEDTTHTPATQYGRTPMNDLHSSSDSFTF